MWRKIEESASSPSLKSVSSGQTLGWVWPRKTRVAPAYRHGLREVYHKLDKVTKSAQLLVHKSPVILCIFSGSKLTVLVNGPPSLLSSSLHVAVGTLTNVNLVYFNRTPLHTYIHTYIHTYMHTYKHNLRL